MKIKEVKNNRINPFPTTDFENFSLLDDWYLPQDLPLLRQLTKNPKLKWDFSGKTLDEVSLYTDIYRSHYEGDLGLLFYRKVSGLPSSLLPKDWVKHRILNKISNEEGEIMKRTIRELWEFQYAIYLHNQNKKGDKGHE